MESPEESTQWSLETSSATEEGCTVKIFLIIFRRDILNELRGKTSDESTTRK